MVKSWPCQGGHEEPKFSALSEGTVSPLVPRGSPKSGWCCELLLEQEIQTFPIPSLTHPWGQPPMFTVPLMPVPFSTNLVSPAAISSRPATKELFGSGYFLQETLLSNSFLALIALEQHQDVISVLFSCVLWKMTIKCHFSKITCEFSAWKLYIL